MPADVLPFGEPGPWEVWAPGTLPPCIACGQRSPNVTVCHARSKLLSCDLCGKMSVVMPWPRIHPVEAATA